MNILVRIGKRLDTERGTVYIEGMYNKDEARENGFTFAFHSGILDCELYQKKMDSAGLVKHFAVVGD